jgi:hypothetical protein
MTQTLLDDREKPRLGKQNLAILQALLDCPRSNSDLAIDRAQIYLEDLGP